MLPKEDKVNSNHFKGVNDAHKTSLYKRLSSSVIPPLTFLNQNPASPNNEEVPSNNEANKDEKTFSDDEDIGSSHRKCGVSE